ncbi:olfactory receptor class A-like protein 1 [Ascaphus truei]|uniref:olfactory receptor class A-like protein 1 n=1 Tax=Ascaphus truei TaxID=8439 RepID=UPI003F5A5897
MDLHLLFKATGLLLLVVIGIPGNVFILLQFTCLRIIEKKLLPANIILMVLALVNLLVILSRGIPQSLKAIGLENVLDDTQCKFVIYTYRVSRAMCICVTSLLSCHQCVLISPTTRMGVYLKQRVTRNVSNIIFIIWLINLIIYPYSSSIAVARGNFTTSPYTLHLMYCDIDFLNYVSYTLNGSFLASRDFIFVGLMTLASTYIVYVLLRHEKTIKDIRSSDRAKGRSVEYKASRAVILLVALYVALFGFDNCMWIYTLTLSNVTPDMNDARIVLACSYSALSPVVIIATNPKLQKKVKCSQRTNSLPWTSQNKYGEKKHVYSISK